MRQTALVLGSSPSATATQFAFSRAAARSTSACSVGNRPPAWNHALARAVALCTTAGAVTKRTSRRLNVGARRHRSAPPLPDDSYDATGDQFTQDGAASSVGP